MCLIEKGVASLHFHQSCRLERSSELLIHTQRDADTFSSLKAN